MAGPHILEMHRTDKRQPNAQASLSSDDLPSNISSGLAYRVVTLRPGRGKRPSNDKPSSMAKSKSVQIARLAKFMKQLDFTDDISAVRRSKGQFMRTYRVYIPLDDLQLT